MDIERTLETQRLRLLRIVAGLVVAFGVLAVGPVSQRFSEWTLGFIASVLSRAEAAARHLVVTQACLIVGRGGFEMGRMGMEALFNPDPVVDEADISMAACQRRLRLLRAVLSDLSRHALRLLRRMARRGRRGCSSHRFDPCLSPPLYAEQSVALRIERPPD